jgi:Na+/H+ antiporter NhaD/arsenite permease-like protein
MLSVLSRGPAPFPGYVKGVPFLWLIENCWRAWLIAIGNLLAIFYAFDSVNFRRPPKDISHQMTGLENCRFAGHHNLVFIATVVGAVLAVPEVIIAGAAEASLFTTPASVHESNDINFDRIEEVAWLFAGIFATMVPVLDYLELHAGEIGLHSAQEFCWATGTLSTLLDNAPTYLTFLVPAMGHQGFSANSNGDVAHFFQQSNEFLFAISRAAILFGAGTYIGKGPNLIVSNIAQQVGVRTPTFVGYVVPYTLPILASVPALVSLLFFSPWRIF